MTIKCLAVDDEPLALDLLEDNILQVPFLNLVAKCRNAMEATEVLKREQVDLLFLDIQMPGLTGLQFIQSLREKPMVILITAYEKYALEGFDLDVVDYLVKPVPFDRFLKACNKAWEFHKLKNQNTPPDEAGHQEDPGYFFVNAEYSLVKVVTNDIIMVEGLKDYIKIHLTGNKPLVIRMPMKVIEEKLPSKKFIRIHKSYIVAISHITSIRKGSVFLGNQELPLSENYKDALFQVIGQGTK